MNIDEIKYKDMKALKDAGFPQPEFSLGQRWLKVPDTLIVFDCIISDVLEYALFIEGQGNFMALKNDKTPLVYCPDESEILSELSNRYPITIRIECSASGFALEYPELTGVTLLALLTKAYLCEI